MNILTQLTELLETLQIPFATGHYGGVPPDEYVVIIPLADAFTLAADNRPQMDIQEARLALYAKGNYTLIRDNITAMLINHDFTITDRRYIEYEPDTGYHHTAIDVEKSYPMEVE